MKVNHHDHHHSWSPTVLRNLLIVGFSLRIPNQPIESHMNPVTLQILSRILSVDSLLQNSIKKYEWDISNFKSSTFLLNFNLNISIDK